MKIFGCQPEGPAPSMKQILTDEATEKPTVNMKIGSGILRNNEMNMKLVSKDELTCKTRSYAKL